MAKQNQSASPSSTARDERAMRRAIARVPPPTITPPTVTPPTVPLPTVPRELSMLSTDTAESIASLEQDARAKIQDYGSQSRQYDKLVKSGLLAFLTWLPEAGKTSLARDVIGASSEQQLYDVFVNLLTGIASPSKYILFKSFYESFIILPTSEISIQSTLSCRKPLFQKSSTR